MVPSNTVTAFTAKPSPLLTFVMLIVLGVVGFYSLHFPPRPTTSPDPSRFRHVFVSSSSNSTVASYLRALTVHPHLSGTKPASLTARYVVNHFTTLGFQTKTVQHSALLSYPVRSSLAAHFSDGTSFEFQVCLFFFFFYRYMFSLVISRIRIHHLFVLFVRLNGYAFPFMCFLEISILNF